MADPDSDGVSNQPTESSSPLSGENSSATVVRHAQQSTVQPVDAARTGRVTGLQASLPQLTKPALELISRLLADVRGGCLSDSELQSRLHTHRGLIGDSWAHHIRALNARFKQTAEYDFEGCTPTTTTIQGSEAASEIEAAEEGDTMMPTRTERSKSRELQPEPNLILDEEVAGSPAISSPSLLVDRPRTAASGAAFSPLKCCCRVWNKGRPKQCSSVPELDEPLCSMHKMLVDRYGGWHLGRYDQPRPEAHLYDCTGHIQQGARIPWEVPELGPASHDANPSGPRPCN